MDFLLSVGYELSLGLLCVVYGGYLKRAEWNKRAAQFVLFLDTLEIIVRTMFD